MSPQFEESHSRRPEVDPSKETAFSAQNRRTLLNLAHEAILSAAEGREISFLPDSSRFATPRGAFTTIYLHGKLRGCVGYALPVDSLYLTIVETSRAAAFKDPRFPPVTLTEARDLEVSLSILSPLQPILPHKVIIGKHGLVVSQSGRRGLLLPQVPVEQGWDQETFLQQTCRKAGLSPDAWKTHAKIEAFTAETFGDRDELR